MTAASAMTADVVHILWRGRVLCAFSTAVPGEWPEGHKWVGINADIGEVTCRACRTSQLCPVCNAMRSIKIERVGYFDCPACIGTPRAGLDAQTRRAVEEFSRKRDRPVRWLRAPETVTIAEALDALDIEMAADVPDPRERLLDVVDELLVRGVIRPARARW